MSARTGLSDLHVAILDAVDRASPAPRTFHKCSHALDLLSEDAGHGPLSAYEELCALATPWTALLPLLEYAGNFGTPGRDDPAADARYTECRLSPAGAAALAAERGDGPPTPLGLVLGDWFLGGRRPSFGPGRVAEAVRMAAGGDLDGAVQELGPPLFPGGLPVRVSRFGEDPRALEYGWLVTCRIDAELTTGLADIQRRPAVHVVGVPPGRGPSQLTNQIAELAVAMNRALGRDVIRDISDQTTMRDGTRIEVVAGDGITAAALEVLLRALPCMYVELDLQLPRPTRELLAGWVTTHGTAAALAGADLLAGVAQRQE